MILITGGAGYIGSHTHKLLASQGRHCRIFDNFSTGHKDFVKWGELVEGDLLNPADLNRAFVGGQIEAVIHFAAKAYVGESMENPAKYYQNNVTGTLNLLTAMQAHGGDKILFSSTCAVYGVPNQVPITESEVPRPINVYGRTKRMIEQILEDYSDAYRLKYTALRYFNAAGADLDLEIGERHQPETHAIPLAIEAAMGLRPSFTIFGQDYPTPDGTCIRDYIHVADLARAHQLALDRLLAGRDSLKVNLGCNQGLSVLELVQQVKELSGRDFKVVQGQRRPGDPAELCADNQMASQELGWKPQFEDPRSIIKSAWDWHQKENH